MSHVPTRPYAVLLALLAGLFLLRVVGQALVAFFQVPGLPPMGEWYSGLVPYPVLLPTQVAIPGVLGWICFQFARGTGRFVRSRPHRAFGYRTTWAYIANIYHSCAALPLP